MAFQKASKPISKSSIRFNKRCNGGSFNICTIATVLLELAFLQFIASLLIMPSSSEAFNREPQLVKVTNNHTNILSVRCFSFYSSENETAERHHLKPNEGFNFTVKPNNLFPSLSMYNCSTNMGVFVAYRYDMKCAEEANQSCDWMFDENRTYHFIDTTWVAFDYSPNYESLGRGGVVRGYFTN